MSQKDLEHHLLEQIENSKNFFWHRLRWKAASSYFLSKQSFSLLDIGAGAGLFGSYLARDFPEARYHFIEPLENVNEVLKKKYGISRDFSKKENYHGIRYLILLDVLEHQKNDKQFLSDIIEKMEKGATLIVSVPAFNFFWTSWDEKLGHFRRYTKKMMKSLIVDEPVQLEEMSYLFPEMSPIAIVRKFLRRHSVNGDHQSDVEFPRLPDWVNNIFVAVGSVILSLRQLTPFGTSLLLCIKKQ